MNLTKLSQRAKSLVKKSKTENYNLTKSDIQFIKKNYNGRQIFRGFYTDYSIAFLMGKLISPRSGKVLDPSCGTGRLFEYIQSSEIDLYGLEIDRESAVVCKLLYPEVNITVCDALSHLQYIEDSFEYVIANPPWGLDVGSKYNNYYLNKLLTEKKSTALFVELCIRCLKENGKGVILVPNSFFSKSFDKARQFLFSSVNVYTIIKLPKNIFYNSNIFVESSIILFINNNKRTPLLELSVDENEWSNIDNNKNLTLANKLVREVNQHLESHVN